VCRGESHGVKVLCFGDEKSRGGKLGFLGKKKFTHAGTTSPSWLGKKPSSRFRWSE
jgi:hypothetical protein